MENGMDAKENDAGTEDARDIAFEVRLLKVLERTPFFAELSRRIRKVSDTKLPTAGVAFDRKRDDLVMYYNPGFISKLTDAEFHGLMTHEFYHIIFQHITARVQKPHRMWNIATDLAINSLIVEEQRSTNSAHLALPAGGLIPGQWPKMPGGREMTKEEKEGAKVAAKIASFPVGEFSEWYFTRLKELADEMRNSCPKHGDGAKQKGGQPGAGEKSDASGEGEGDGDAGGESGEQPGPGEKQPGGSQPGGGGGGHAHDPNGGAECTCGEDWADGFDDHEGWEDLTDEEREYVEGRVRDAVGKAAKHANTRPDGWGNMPASMRERISAMVNGVIDWKTVLRQFVGSVCRASRHATMKRINRKYPYIHAGSRKDYKPKLLIAVDMSGSVGDDALELFFGELNNLTRDVSITVAPFDTEVDEADVFEWRKGQKVAAQRTKCGGTDFNAPTRFANDPKRRGQWDGLLIMTDGCAPDPEPSRVKRGWVLAPGCKMYFPTQETVIETAHPAKK